MSDTPRTDAALVRILDTAGIHRSYVPPLFARELERENAELRESVHYANGTATLAMKHRDIAEAQVKELREALDVADECLSLIEDSAHAAFGTNIASARRVVLRALERTAEPFTQPAPQT